MIYFKEEYIHCSEKNVALFINKYKNNLDNISNFTIAVYN